MANDTMIKAILIVLKIFSYVLSASSYDSKISKGFTLKMIHQDSPESPTYSGNLTNEEKMKKYIAMSNAKVQSLKNSFVLKNNESLSSLKPNDEIIRPKVIQQYNAYMVQVGIGSFENENPSYKTYHLNFDTGSDITWTQCEAAGDRHFPQVDPLFPASRSSTYEPFPSSNCPPDSEWHDPERGCIIKLKYVDKSIALIVAAKEVFTFATPGGRSTFPLDLIFGCGIDMKNFKGGVYHSDNMVSGIMGMGYGFYGLMEQTQLMFDGKFSYCMQSQLASSTSSVPMYLRFGNDVLPRPLRSLRGMQLTPIYRYGSQPVYYLTLEDISVASRRLYIPPQLFAKDKRNRIGGFFLDSGTTLSYIIKDAYAILERAIIDFINEKNRNTRKMDVAELGYKLCFERYEASPTYVNLPDIIFHFSYNADYAGSTNRDHNDMYCLNFFEDDQTSLLGVLHQVDKRIIYDTQNSMLSFDSVDCAREN